MMIHGLAKFKKLYADDKDIFAQTGKTLLQVRKSKWSLLFLVDSVSFMIN